jgi:hypothetical protein
MLLYMRLVSREVCSQPMPGRQRTLNFTTDLGLRAVADHGQDRTDEWKREHQ